MENIKSKSFFRTEAFGAVFLLFTVVLFYFFFLMEVHIKGILEKSAFETLGSEVNISKLHIDVFKSLVKFEKIEITDPDRPEKNFIEFKTILINYDLMSFLSGSFISNLTNVIGVQFHTKRKYKGRVLPKSKRLMVLKDPSNQSIQSSLRADYKDMAFSDLISLFKNKDFGDLEKRYKDKLETLKVSEKLQGKLKTIKSKLLILKTFKEKPEVKLTLDEIKKFKFKSKTNSGVLNSAQSALKLIKKVKGIQKGLKSETSSLKKEIKAFKGELQSSSNSFIKDLESLKKDFSLTQLSPEKISENLLSEYFTLQFNQIGRVTESVKSEAVFGLDDYVDVSKLPQKKDEKGGDISQISLEAEKEKFYYKKSKTFIFYKDRVLPKFWFKKINITSQAAIGQDLGDVKGYILNLSKSPSLIGKPMDVNISGSSPKNGIGSFKIKALVDHVNIAKKKEEVSLDVSDYIVEGLKLVNSDKNLLKVLKSSAKTLLNIKKRDEKIEFTLKQTLKTPEYRVDSKDKNVKLILNEFKELRPDLIMSLKASGELKSPKISIKSNLGDVLVKILSSGVKREGQRLLEKNKLALNDKVRDKLSPYIKDLDVMNLKSGEIEKQLLSMLNGKIKDLSSSKKNEVRKKAKKALKKLFDKL